MEHARFPPNAVAPRLDSRFLRAGIRNTPRDAMRPSYLNYKKESQDPVVARCATLAEVSGKREKEIWRNNEIQSSR